MAYLRRAETPFWDPNPEARVGKAKLSNFHRGSIEFVRRLFISNPVLLT